MKQKTALIAAGSLFLGLLFDWFFNGKEPGASVFLYTFIILGLTGFFMWQFRQPINKAIYWLAPLSLFFAFMVFLRANQFLAFINICLVVYLLLMIVRMARNPDMAFASLKVLQYLTLGIRIPFAIMQSSLQSLLKSLSYRKTSHSSMLPIIRGLLISLPVLFVFLLLLSSADLVFKRLIDSLFDVQLQPDLVGHMLLIGFVGSLFVGAYALIFMAPSEPDPMLFPDGTELKLGATEASIVLGSVSGLFLIFVLIQLAYLFGGSDQMLSAGYTYAEYARKGFFELIAVASISLMLIVGIKKVVRLHTKTEKTTFKWLCGVLIVEVLIIMLSAHMRLNLYEEAYGFTTLRLWSHLFIFWLVIAFGLLAAYIIREGHERQFAFQLFVSVIGFFALINILNPDSFIAQKNIERLNETGKIDMHYIGGLSEDATPAIIGLLDHKDKVVRQGAADALYRKKERSSHEDGWQSVNAAKEQAKDLLRNRSPYIEPERPTPN